MSELIEPGKLPEWDRSPEGVHNAMGRIIDRLSERAITLVGDNPDNPPLTYSDGSKTLKTVRHPGKKLAVLKSRLDNREMRIDTGDSRIPHRDGSITTERFNLVGVIAEDSEGNFKAVRAHSSDGGDLKASIQVVEGLDTDYSRAIQSSSAVADVAANALNQVRGEIAEAEIDTKQQMIDFLNNKENKK